MVIPIQVPVTSSWLSTIPVGQNSGQSSSGHQCGTEGRTFESCRVRQSYQRIAQLQILKILHLCHFCPISISERTGLSISQVTDEVLYAGLVDMQEIDEL